MKVKIHCMACTGERTCPFCLRNLSGIHHTASRTVNYKQHIRLEGNNRIHHPHGFTTCLNLKICDKKEIMKEKTKAMSSFSIGVISTFHI